MITPAGFPRMPAHWHSSVRTQPVRPEGEPLFQLFHCKEKISRPDPVFLFLIHGMGEHSGRYLHFPFFLDGQVDGILTYDHLGHGRSAGIRGHIDNFDDLVLDAHALLLEWQHDLQRDYPRARFHLMGHSMGGLVALRMMQKFPRMHLDSAIISSPLLGLRVDIPLIKRGAAHLLSQVWGQLQMKNEIQPQKLSHDPAVVAAYQQDSLVHAWGTPRTYTQLQQAMADTMEKVGGFRIPTLFLIAGEDQIVDSEQAKRFALRLRPPASVNGYPGYYHETFNEGDPQNPQINKRQVFEDIQTWIRQKTLSS